MSGKRNLTVRFDFERNETWRYERKEMAAAIAACELSASLQRVYAVASYLSVYNCMFAVYYDLPGRRDHKGRHHGRRLLPKQSRVAILRWSRDGGEFGGQLGGHCVYGRGFGCLCAMRRGGARLKEGCGTC